MAQVFAVFRESPDLAVLYAEPAVVYGVFRQLTPLAQHFVVTFLFLDSVDADYFTLLVRERSLSDTTLDELLTLNIYQPDARRYRLHPHFATQLKSLLLGEPTCRLRLKRKVDKRKPSAEQLEAFCKVKWRNLLNYLAGFGEQPSERLIYVLSRLALKQASTALTSECFRFLLQTRRQQLSLVLSEYVRSRTTDKASALRMLFNLSTAVLGASYTSGSDPSLMADLGDLGLVYKSKLKSKRFYITMHMQGLLTDSNTPVLSEDQFLVVETSFRVYAYTHSDVHVTLLSQFLDLETRLPDLVISLLTRDSMQRAFDKGIGASEVVAFLQKHARYPVAPNVKAQVALWEEERKRVTQEPAVMLEDFIDMAVYRSTLKYVTDLGACLWEDEVRRVIVVKQARSQQAIDFIHKQERL